MQRDLPGTDHYEWFSGYLGARGVKPAVRLFVGATALSMAVALLVLLTGAGGPSTEPQRTMMWIAAGGGAAGTVLWLWRWPSRLQSGAFAAVTTLSITLSCLAYPDPLAALLGCIAFTTIGAYLAFFHSTRAVFAFVLVVAAVAASQAVEMALGGRIALAAVDFFLVMQANIAMPVAIHALLRALRGDLAHADLDPLTGLLNRRAFRRQTLAMVTRKPREDGYLLVALIDLDDFKSLNDTHGHIAGDHALVAVAEALRATATPTAVIGRSGGEEFLIADVTSSDDAVQRYQEVCDAIAAVRVSVTASVGTALAPLDALAQHSHDDVVDHLIAAADSAMYRAKRNGGNQCHHHGLWVAPGTAS
jgi:diguanylate cyclase (GGDEF)-like protein